MRRVINKKVVMALAILAVIFLTSAANAFCRNRMTSPSCCEGKCQGQSMPAQDQQSNNCCTVSDADTSQPALMAGTGQNSSPTRLAASAPIEFPIYWRIILGQPLFPSLGTYRHRLRHIRDLPTLVCSLLM